MSEYKVIVNLRETSSETTQEAPGPIEAAFYAGIALGSGITVKDPHAPTFARLFGVGYIQQEIIEATTRVMRSVVVEEL